MNALLAESLNDTLALDMALASPLSKVIGDELLEWMADHAIISRCHYCAKPLLPNDRTRDHIVPKYLGGSNKAMNLVPSCYQCNRNKGASAPDPHHCETCWAAVRWHQRRDRRIEQESRIAS